MSVEVQANARAAPRRRSGTRAVVIVGALTVMTALLHAATHVAELQSPTVAFGSILLGALLVVSLPAAVVRGLVSGLIVVASLLLSAFIVAGIGSDAEVLALAYLLVLIATVYTLPRGRRERFALFVGALFVSTLTLEGRLEPPHLAIYGAAAVTVAMISWRIADVLYSRLARAAASRRDAELRAGLLASLAHINTLEPETVVQAVVDGVEAAGLPIVALRGPDDRGGYRLLATSAAAYASPWTLPADDPLLQAAADARAPVEVDGGDPRLVPHGLEAEHALVHVVVGDASHTPIAIVAGARNGPVTAFQHEAVALLGDQATRIIARVEEYESDGRTVQQLRDLESRVNDFVSTVSHELRTPLTVVEGLSATLQRRWEDLPPARRHDLLERVANNTVRLETMVQSLLRTAALDGGQLSPAVDAVAIGEVTLAVLGRLGSLLDDRDVTCTIDDTVLVAGDRALLEHVFENLLTNAAKYTPPGTSVRISARRDGERVEVEVADTGPGIAPEDLPLILNRFYRGTGEQERRTGGLGLGLALSRQIIEAHGGQLHVDSTPGGGATFRFGLPAA